MNGLPTPVVCLVTDRHRLTPHGTTEESVKALEAFLAEAVDARVDLVQVRERDLDAGPLCRVVRHVVDRARGTGVRVVVNDRADVALAAGADGVHLRADSQAASRVRLLSRRWIIGRSVHSSDLVQSDADADYLLYGILSDTASKPGASPAGLEPLSALASSVRVPVLAIGGITPARARDCRRAGAAGVAGIGVFLPKGAAPGALGVHAAVRAFRETLADG